MTKKSKNKRILDKVIMGAVIGGAIGSVVGGAVSSPKEKKRNFFRKLINIFRRKKK